MGKGFRSTMRFSLLCPTRQRTQSLKELIDSIIKTTHNVDNFELLTNIEHREKHNKHDLKKVKCSVCEKEFYLIRNIASKRKANFCCSEECVRKNKTAEQIKRRKYWTQDDIIEYNRKERERTAKKRLLETEDQKNKRNKKALEYYHKNKNKKDTRRIKNR